MTFTIVARDPITRELGVATTTCLVGVGDVVPAAASGIAVVGCQAQIRPSSRAEILSCLGAGMSMKMAIESVLSDDPYASKRQILGIGAQHQPFVYTGSDVDTVCGAIMGEHHAVAGNLLANSSVLHAMDMNFLSTPSEPLAQRMVRALLCGEQAGGDKRGRMSAALLLVEPTRRPLSLRIDYSDDPVRDLQTALMHRVSSGIDEAFNR